MSASFSKKLVNVPRNRNCLNCHRLPLQHPYCTCVCLGVCVHACFNSLLPIVPARWDQFYIERSIISSYQSFRQFNRISGSFIYKSKCSSSILKPLHKQDTAQDDANAPERQSHWFFSGDPRFTFDISKCTVVWLQASNQKREVYFFGICFTCGNLLLVEKSAHMQMSNRISAWKLLWCHNLMFDATEVHSVRHLLYQSIFKECIDSVSMRLFS